MELNWQFMSICSHFSAENSICTQRWNLQPGWSPRVWAVEVEKLKWGWCWSVNFLFWNVREAPLKLSPPLFGHCNGASFSGVVVTILLILLLGWDRYLAAAIKCQRFKSLLQLLLAQNKCFAVNPWLHWEEKSRCWQILLQILLQILFKYFCKYFCIRS